MDDHVLDVAGARSLCDLTSRLMTASRAPEMAATIAETAHGVVGASYAQLGLPASDGETLVLYHGADLDERAQEEWPVVPLDLDTPVSRVMSRGQPLAFQSAAELVAEFPIIGAASDASGYESLVVVPIPDPMRPGPAAGTLSVAWAERDRATDRALEIMADLAERCALALARVERSPSITAGGREEREIVLALQQSLLPSIRVDHRRLEIASRYIASADDLVVGGDWYATVPLPDDRVVMAIGDVAGHGFEAALTMGQIRHDLDALAAHHATPNDLLTDVDRYLEQRGSVMTTAATVYVDVEGSCVTCVAAGHPPPILLSDESATFLDYSLGPPLGTGLSGPGWPAATWSTIGPDDVLVLYTDGLVERRGEAIDHGIERLRQVTGSVTDRDAEAVCDHVVEAMLTDYEPRDDVALLVARFR